tara:strand:- start:257 stop:1303 length:1047 start_codon:yes stop_codon:yes gene_type:complete
MKEGAKLRFILVAMPAGIMLLGVLSMIGSHLKKADEPMDPNESIRLEAARLKQQPVNRADLERYLTILCEQIGERNVGKPEKLEQAAIWIHSTLGGRNLGYSVRPENYVVETESGESLSVRNLIAELPGLSRRDEIVVVGAHYDTVTGCPGANDNGTGVVALLSLAQALAGEQQERTVRFVAFVNEEPPYFHTESMGSLVHARGCRERDENIVAMISLETIGCYTNAPSSQKIPEGLEGEFPTVGNFLAFVGNSSSQFLADSARSAFMSASGIPALAGGYPETVPGVAWSDHWSFWQAGYPAIMVTDTAPYRYAHYHKPTDTIDKVDFDKLEDAVKGLEAVVRAWANP